MTQKKGSTALQKNVFPNIPNISYRGPFFGAGSRKPFADFEDQLIAALSKGCFSIKNLAIFLAAITANSEKTVLYSSEGLIRPRSVEVFLDSLGEEKITELYKIYIILANRNLNDWVVSRYRHNLRRYPTVGLNQFIPKFFRNLLKTNNPISYGLKEALNPELVQCAFPYCVEGGMGSEVCSCIKQGIHPINTKTGDADAISLALEKNLGEDRFLVLDLFSKPAESNMISLIKFLDISVSSQEFDGLVSALNAVENKG